jgi:hypothetical protein
MSGRQASYAAPLILLARTARPSGTGRRPRPTDAPSMRTQADTEYLAREVAAIRLALGEMLTRDYLAENWTACRPRCSGCGRGSSPRGRRTAPGWTIRAGRTGVVGGRGRTLRARAAIGLT